MGARSFLSVLFSRILLPFSLLTASILRQNILSLVYFLFLLVSPLVRRNKHAFEGGFRAYIIIILVYSVLVCAAQIVFQTYLGLYAVLKDVHYGDNLRSCALVEILQWIGFERVDAPLAQRYHVVRLLLPDFIILIISVITFLVLRKVLRPDRSVQQTATVNPPRSKQPGVVQKYVETAGELTIIVLLGVSGSMMPSLLSVFYILIFLGVTVYWSLLFTFNMKAYGVLKMVIFGYLTLHMLTLYICQLGPVQHWLDNEERHYYSRLFGLTPLITTDCSAPWAAHIEKLEWPYFANPIALFITYVAIALDYSYHRDRRVVHQISEDSPFRRGDTARTSEHQLLANESQPSYDAVGTSPPISPERRPSTTDSEPRNDEVDGVIAEDTRQKVRKFWTSIYHLLMKNSYLLAFIAMMLWAVLYPSWTAFVFLIIGCLVWLFPNSRRATMLISPLLVAYGVALVVLQYVCSINYGGIEYTNSSTLFFNVSDNYVVESIGLRGNDYPAIALILKMLFLACFCIVLRELRREQKQPASQNGEPGLCMATITTPTHLVNEDDAQSIDNSNLKAIGKKIKYWFCKYWIMVVYAVLLAMAIPEPYVYRLVYMMLFLFSAITFHISYTFWRFTLRAFLIILAMYSIIAILVVYIFSFNPVLKAFQNATHLEDKWLADIGFDPEVNYQQDAMKVQLLTRLIVPAVLLITVMLQIHLFHNKFMQLTEPNAMYNRRQNQAKNFDNLSQRSAASSQGGFMSDIVKTYKQMLPYGHFIGYSLARICTIHMNKVVYVIMTYTVTREASAMGFVLLIILNFSMYFKPTSPFRKFFILVAQFWVGIIILAKMMFQLRTVPKDSFLRNCTFDNNRTWHDNITWFNMTQSSPIPHSVDGTQDAAQWFGLRTLNPDSKKFSDSLPNYIGSYVVILALLTLLALFKNHDDLIYKNNPMPEGVTFLGISYKNLDEKFRYLVGYLLNYAFVKFGLEICFMTSAVVIFYRQDAAGAIYVLLLGILLVLNMIRRRYVRYVWFLYLVILSLLLPAQYLSSLGLPPTLCEVYPWSRWGSDEEEILLYESLRLWLVLPDYTKPPDIKYLMADCIQLLMVSLQWHVFRMEADPDSPVMKEAGDNKELGDRPPEHFQYMTDFMDKKHYGEGFFSSGWNFGHLLMSGIFMYWWWLAISILFVTGTLNINFYCLGYLVFCFYFFWHGLDFTIKKKRATFLNIWNGLLFYNFLVILTKTWLQILGCVFLGQMLRDKTLDSDAQKSQCYAPELFSIRCLNPQFEGQKSKDQVCGVSEKEAGLVWDILAFVALLIQRRVYMSTYFLIVLCEEKSQAKLASRGAQLISRLLMKRLTEQERDHEEELRKISQKMEKIKLRNRRLGGVSKDDWLHYDVIRSGDPSMFDEGSDDETTTADLSELQDVDELIDDRTGRRINPVKMIVTAIDDGIDASLGAAAKTKQQHKQGFRRPVAAESTGATAADPSSDEVSDPVEVAGAGFSRTKYSSHEELDTTDRTDDAPVSAGDVRLEHRPTSRVSPDRAESSDSIMQQVGDQVKTGDRWVKAFAVVCLKWVIVKLNMISRDYRTVATRLDKDQVKEKAKERERMMSGEDDGEVMPPENDISSHTNLKQQEDEWKEALEKKSLLYRFFNAIYLALIARTEFICYFFMFLCHICYGNILSLPLPICAVLWGMLSLPRPAKTFWITVLTYVMFVVVVKYVFKFSFLPWNSKAITSWSDWRLLLGVRNDDPLACTNDQGDDLCVNGKAPQTESYYATYELLVLLSVFVHRSVLKRYGLWRNEEQLRADLVTQSDSAAANLTFVNSSDSEVDVLNGGDSYQRSDDSTGLVESKENKSFYKWWKYARQADWFPAITTWYSDLRSGKQFIKGDYYAVMVLCDFINFIISVFAFSWFGPPQSGNFQDYIQENRVPVPFLILLLVQFIMIVIDRALYLRKSVVGKLIYHVILVVAVHIWLFFILPYLTNIPFNQNPPAQLWYFIKCFYFGLSAWQIKSGYPTGVLGNFLTTKYGYLNLVLFKAFMITPFLLELRCVMDWMWTETSMSIGSWFTMEDIFAKIFTIKCFRQGEKEYPFERAQNRKPLVKYGLGGFILASLLFVIWFPLVIFSFANTIYLPNPPSQCEMIISIGGYQDLFTVRSQESGITDINPDDLLKLRASYNRSSPATGFLDIYEQKDIRLITLNGESTAVWGITQPSRDKLLQALINSTDTLPITVRLSFTRVSKKGLTASTISTEYVDNLKNGSEQRQLLYEQIKSESGDPTQLSDFLPRYLYLPATGQPSAVTSLHCAPDGCTDGRLSIGAMPYNGITLKISKSGAENDYWSIQQTSNCTQQVPPVCSKTKTEKYSNLFFVTFNERVAPESVSLITGPGIIGLYIGMVFVIGQFVRSLTSGGSQTIMFDELPNVDRVMRICKDLYFVRENGELALEEELYAKLIYLYRSPEMLIKWTKRKVS